MDDRARTEHAGQKRRAVAERDGDHVGGEPKLRVEHRLQDVHRVAGVEAVGHHERERAARGRHKITDPESFK